MENLSTLLEKFQPTLNEMSVKMGLAIEELWRILLKQQLVDGISGIFMFIGGLILIYFCIKLFKWCQKNDAEGLIILPLLLAVFGTVLVIIGLGEAVSHFVNPEYQAIKDIFKIINTPS